MRETEVDNSNINKLWDECSQSIRKLCEIKLQSSPEAAEDVYSEVFLALTKAVKAGREITYYKAWLYKTANNLISKKYDEINKGKEVFISFNDIKSDLVELSVNVDIVDAVINDKTIDLMADDIIDSLTDEEQKILQYYHYDNIPLRDIAERIGKTESAVKQQHYRLCKRIKMRVKEKIENF